MALHEDAPKDPKAADETTASDLPPAPSPQQIDATGDGDDDTPPIQHTRPHNGEDAAAASALPPASTPASETEQRKSNEADKSRPASQKREDDEDDDAPSTQLARPPDGGIAVVCAPTQQPCVCTQQAAEVTDNNPPIDEVGAARDGQGERAHLKRGASTEAAERLALTRGLRAPRKKRLAFAVAEASLPSPDSFSEDASDEEYEANSWEDDDEGDDEGISLDLAQAEATQELEELSGSESDLEQKNPATIPDDPKSGGVSERVELTKSGGALDSSVPDPVTRQIDDESDNKSSEEDEAIAMLEASRGHVVEDEGAFMEGFSGTFDNWDSFFAALKTHSEETFQLLSKRTSYSAALRNKKLEERGVSEDDEQMLPAAMPYYSVTLMCTHGIKHPKKGKGSRQRRIIRFLGCTAKVKALSKRDETGDWKVKVTWEGAHNHVRSAELFRYYSENRRITDPDVLLDVARMKKSGSSAKGILQYLREETGKSTELRDVHNLIASNLVPIDLLEEYGYDQIERHAAFPDPEVAGHFIRDFAVNSNKGVAIKNNNGDYKKWVCSANGCKWFVSISRRRVKENPKSKRKRPASKLSHLPPDSWYISNFNLQHAQCCTSTANPSGKQIARLPGFQASILEGHNTSKSRVVNNLKVIENINVSDKSAVLYRIIKAAITGMTSNSVEGFNALPAYMELFAQQNPGSRVCCQLDTSGRFFRSFLSIGATVAIQDSLLPVWESDGTHMKDADYNGVCVTLLGKDGDKRIVPVAVAYVHKETTDNFVWFFANCIAAGIALHDRPTFTDRGKQLLAQAVLSRWGLRVNIKFCAVHIRFNTVDKFKKVGVTKEKVNDEIMNLQASRSMREYEHNINRLRKLFPTPITTTVEGKPKQEYVDSYLRSIHPTNWTVVGNSTLSDEESKWLGDNWNATSTFGDGMPLFGVRSTSGVEGDNNGLLWKRARSLSVFRALRAYCLRAVGTCRSLMTETDKWIAADCDITPHAKRIFDDEKSQVAKLTVVPSKMPFFYVFDPFDRSDVASATTMYETNMSSGTCRPCKVAQQLQIPCRHIQAVIYSLEQQNKGRPPVYDVIRYFHPAYLVRTIHEAFRSVEIKLPVDTISTSTNNVLPAPLYRQAGGSRKVKAADIQRGQKRIRSRGEEPKATRTKHAGTRGSGSDALGADEHDETPAINAFFESQLSAPSRKERADYHCTNCGLVGHNATLCTFTVHDVEEAGSAICPGLYVLGEPPLTSCGVSATSTCEASEEDIN